MSDPKINENELLGKLEQKYFSEEAFEKFENKVQAVQNIIQRMNSQDIVDQIDAVTEADKLTRNNEINDEDSFIVHYRDDRTVINKQPWKDDSPAQMDQFTFMKQVEEDAKQRSESRRENETIAHNFRQLGNTAFRKKEYEKAINFYTKAIDHVNDSSILYSNRALTYIKLKLFKRAVNDCDYVVNKLDEKNLRGWLYRATAYFNLHDDQNYEMSIKMAKKNNSKEIEYINNYIAKLKLENNQNFV